MACVVGREKIAKVRDFLPTTSTHNGLPFVSLLFPIVFIVKFDVINIYQFLGLGRLEGLEVRRGLRPDNFVSSIFR